MNRSLDDAVLLARQLYHDIGDIFAEGAGGPAEGGGERGAGAVDTIPDPLIRARVAALGARLEGTVDERALDDVVPELRALLSHLGREHGGGSGPWSWHDGKSRRNLYLMGGAVAALLVVGLAVVVLRRAEPPERTMTRYNELFQNSNVLMSQGKHAEAVQAYRAALAVLPNDKKSADSYNNLGWSLQQLGKLDEAIEAYTAALKLNPGLQLARNNLNAALQARQQRRVPQTGPSSRPQQ
jgi:tetratricopeptide (TPR) repeat protein